MHEIERKFLLLLPATEIERLAAAAGTLGSRRLLQQRYLPTRGWRLRAKAVPDDAGGLRRVLSFKRRAPCARLDFDVDAEAWRRLTDVCAIAPAKPGDPAGTLRLRLDDLSGWTVRLRRSSAIAGHDVRCALTMKKGVTDVTCREIESGIPLSQHDAAVPRCGPAVRKRRVRIDHAGRCWEVDSFSNPELAGLEFAEVELPSEDAVIVRPDWIGREVTEDRAYRNARMARRLAA